MAETITITVDGETVQTSPGTSVLAAALGAGICIPNLCLLPGAAPIGACRVCLVEVERHGRLRMTASCTLDARDGMVIHAHSENVLRARRNIVELLLAEVPDSPVCTVMPIPTERASSTSGTYEAAVVVASESARSKPQMRSTFRWTERR